MVKNGNEKKIRLEELRIGERYSPYDIADFDTMEIIPVDIQKTEDGTFKINGNVIVYFGGDTSKSITFNINGEGEIEDWR